MNNLSFHLPVLSNDSETYEIINFLNDLLTDGVQDVRIFFDTLFLQNSYFKGGCFHSSEIRYVSGPVVFTNSNRCIEISKSPFKISPYYLFSPGQNIKNLMFLLQDSSVKVIVKEKDKKEYDRVSGGNLTSITLEQFDFQSIKKVIK